MVGRVGGWGRAAWSGVLWLHCNAVQLSLVVPQVNTFLSKITTFHSAKLKRFLWILTLHCFLWPCHSCWRPLARLWLSWCGFCRINFCWLRSSWSLFEDVFFILLLLHNRCRTDVKHPTGIVCLFYLPIGTWHELAYFEQELKKTTRLLVKSMESFISTKQDNLQLNGYNSGLLPKQNMWI